MDNAPSPKSQEKQEKNRERARNLWWIMAGIVVLALVLVTRGRILFVGARTLLSPIGLLVLLGGALLLVGMGSRTRSSSTTEEEKSPDLPDPPQPEDETTLRQLEQKSDRMLWEADPQLAAELGATPPDHEEASRPEEEGNA